MKAVKHTDRTDEKDMKQSYELNNTPVNMLLGLATATTCSALAVKLLKKGELALLMTIMAIPVTLICLNRSNRKVQCKH
ncbi:hypothetical protein [Arachidicoccus terrestris]|uniref:hypothetical protein n=1 Tax=Arachidicoccus terrestris TaxID=2875539 RepID=UPI001CC506A7|nr:hypothetical protein [Arachidicoccus terrestris]UAY55923.1 hypothetical protein K9M52_02500 [Arachidicoccus terrestris]